MTAFTELWAGLCIGLLFGAVLGVIAMALCQAGKTGDEE